jgi:hypothetical protein
MARGLPLLGSNPTGKDTVQPVEDFNNTGLTPRSIQDSATKNTKTTNVPVHPRPTGPESDSRELSKAQPWARTPETRPALHGRSAFPAGKCQKHGSDRIG